MLKLLFTLLCVATFSVSIFGQTLEVDLRKHFTKFTVVQINDREALEKARSLSPFNIRADEKNFQFILRFNDIRTDDYWAEYTDRDGRHTLPRGEVFTFKSTLIGEPKSVVALTVDGSKTEGYFATESEGYFMESARNYSSHARDDDKVIYQIKDKVRQDDEVYGLDEAVSNGMQIVNSNANFGNPTNLPGRRILRVATEARNSFVNHPDLGNGNVATANSHILSVMNQVDAIYEIQLNISVVVPFQHAWASNIVDPYPNTTVSDILLDSFLNYWNTNFPSSNPLYGRDVAHLFTVQSLDAAGVAYNDVVCFPNGSYSLTSSLNSEKWITVAHEIGHNLSARHTDEPPVQSACVDTIMQSVFFPIYTQFCAYSVNQITSYVANSGGCLATEPPIAAKTLFDFDGDGEADLSVFRPSNSYWYVQKSTAGFYALAFGLSTDKLSSADFDGDNKTDIAVFRNGTWYIQRSTDGFIGIAFGASGDIPVPGDFTGDGKAEMAVFRPSNGYWYIYDLTNNNTGATAFGTSGDDPLIGEFDGDAKADYAVYRPSSGQWRIQRSTLGFYSLNLGSTTDIPTPADYDGDGKTDIAGFVPSTGTWYLQRSTLGYTRIDFGQSGDIPNPADYDGDEKADISIFRPSTGVWYRINSSTNSAIGIAFGQNGDTPIPSFNILQ